MFENLTDKLEKSFKLLKGQGKITEINVAETLKEVRRALLDADVNYKIAKDFTARVKDHALGQEVIKAINPGQLMIKIVYDELVADLSADNLAACVADGGIEAHVAHDGGDQRVEGAVKRHGDLVGADLGGRVR